MKIFITGNNNDFVDSTDQHCILSIDHGNITVHNNVLDYCLRAEDDVFNNLSLWDFVASTEKISQSSENQRMASHIQNEHAVPGRGANARGKFDHFHPQHSTHLLRLKDHPVIPVLIGPAIPRPDRGDEEYENYIAG